MIATSRRGTRISRLLAAAFPLPLAGCTSANSGPDGMRVGDVETGAAGRQGLVRSVIVGANGDERCGRHEERHAPEGACHR